MKLAPLSQVAATEYPARRAATAGPGRWARRIGVAVVASAALWLNGCLPIALGGDVAGPSFFFCAETSPESTSNLEIPGEYGGVFCADQNAWAEFTVEEQETVSLGLTADATCEAVAFLINPEGIAEEIVEANEDDIPVTLEPGRYLLAINHGGECEGWSFDVHLDTIEE